MDISATQRAELQGTRYATVRTFAELLHASEVQIRPAALVWRVLRKLSERNGAPEITVDEFESYLMRCSRNDEFAVCSDAIIRARTTGVSLPPLGTRQRRNAQDWFKFLRLTTIFNKTDGRNPILSISNFGSQYAEEIDEICMALESSATFWEPGVLSQPDRLRWYAEFGGVDLSIPQLPKTEAEADVVQEEFVAGEEQEDKRVPEDIPKGGSIELRAFQGIAYNDNQLPNQGNLTIQSVYSAELTRSAHRLHDQMVCLIAQTCQAKGAEVFDDPDSVDLLVQHQQREFIVEVKSVTQRNFIARLRYALGQVLHYDFLRAPDSQLPRRKVIALAANVPSDSWSVRFLNSHLDIDLLTLDAGRLRIHSRSDASLRLFG